MIKERSKKIDVPVHTPQSYEKVSVTVYTCSDGKEFTSENDHLRGYKKGAKIAREYEERLQQINAAKKELKFHSITNGKLDNEGYERNFLFYFKKGLSRETQIALVSLVHSIRYTEDLDKMEEGWYLVEQYVYEVESGGMCSKYECKGFAGLLSVRILQVENQRHYYNNLLETTKSL